MRILYILALLLLTSPLTALEPENVLIVANEKAEGSVEIAEYYARLRGIPKDQILKISASEKEEISREEFNRDLLAPIKKYVLAHDNILVIVPTRGVPLKVKEVDKSDNTGNFAGRDYSSVGADLALIRFGDYEVKGIVENPWYGKDEPLTLETRILAVARLDGPTIGIAKGLVEKAILAEALGCEGESFLDTRGPDVKPGHKPRDVIMQKVAEVWKRAGLPFDHDTDPKVLDLSTRKETLHYYGWYAGKPKQKAPAKFRTGGIAIHLHSSSGATVRNIKRNWCAPLLAWNATCTYGTCYEPYTVGFPYEQIFWDRLCAGYSFGEAAQMANKLLSWQAVFVGDPLYTPYPSDAERKQAYRTALLLKLLPPDEEEVVPVDESKLPLTAACVNLLTARADAMRKLVRRDPKRALAMFNDLRFLVRDFGLDEWIGEISKPFTKEMKRRLGLIKLRIKADLTDTSALEDALASWKGMPIYDELEEFRDDVAKDQEKAAAKLVKKADRRKGRTFLKAWLLAAEATLYNFAPSAIKAKEILAEIAANEKAEEKLTAGADKELKKIVARAESEFKRKRYEKARALLHPWANLYPDCEQRKAALALLKKVDAEIAKKGG